MIGVAALLFSISALILTQVLPGPHTVRDYFIIGCLATLVSLFALFLMLIKTSGNSPNLFFTRRKK